MNPSKVNLVLTLLLLFAVFALFMQSTKISSSLEFNQKRIDELEKRPISTTAQYFPQSTQPPEAGASAVPIASVAPSAQPTQTPKPADIRQTTYISLGSSGSTTSTNWIDLSGNDAFIDLGTEYGVAAYVTWEAILSAEAGSGESRARLFDVTHGVAVPNSEVLTSQGAQTLVQSGKLILLSGNNRYRVQLKSQTSTNVNFHYGRIKIVH